MIKIYLLCLGLFWSGGLLTLHALKYINLTDNKDFFISVFGGSAAGLGLSKGKSGNKSESGSETDS
jgi:hypothetical protein